MTLNSLRFYFSGQDPSYWERGTATCTSIFSPTVSSYFPFTHSSSLLASFHFTFTHWLFALEWRALEAAQVLERVCSPQPVRGNPLVGYLLRGLRSGVPRTKAHHKRPGISWGLRDLRGEVLLGDPGQRMFSVRGLLREGRRAAPPQSETRLPGWDWRGGGRGRLGPPGRGERSRKSLQRRRHFLSLYSLSFLKGEGKAGNSKSKYSLALS